jgi:hypothetical protein
MRVNLAKGSVGRKRADFGRYGGRGLERLPDSCPTRSLMGLYHGMASGVFEARCIQLYNNHDRFIARLTVVRS